MKILFKLFIFLLFFLNFNLLQSVEKIVFVDMDFLFSTSKAGKSISKQLNKIHKSNIEKISKFNETLKEDEKNLLAKKNILSEENYLKEISEFRLKAEKLKNDRKQLIASLTKKKLESTGKLVEVIRPILAEYSLKNSISIIVQKKNIIIGKSELDITQQILQLVDKKIATIKIK